MSIPLLICDDSLMARKQVAKSLPQDWDVDITFATNGLEGIEAIRAGKGEMVFLDLTMPEMDGIACLEEVMKAVPSISVLVVSALDDKPTAIKALKLGARGFIRKPFTDEQLVQAFLQLIDQP